MKNQCTSPHEHEKKEERYMIIPIYSEKSSGKIRHPFIMHFLKIPLSKLKKKFFDLTYLINGLLWWLRQ